MAINPRNAYSAQLVTSTFLIVILAIYLNRLYARYGLQSKPVALPLAELDCANADLLEPLRFQETPDNFVLIKTGADKPSSPASPLLLSAVTTFFGAKDAANVGAFLDEIGNQSLLHVAQAELLAGTTARQVCAAPRTAAARLLAFFAAPAPPHSTLVFFKRDPGLYGMWNALIRDFAAGSLVTNANMDDRRRWDAWAVKAHRLMASAPDVGVVSGPVYFASHPVESWAAAEAAGLHHLHLMFDDVAGRDDLQLMEFFRINTIEGADAVWPFNFPHNAPVWRRDLHARLGYFNSSFSPFSDFEYWLRCRAAGVQFSVMEEGVDVFFEDPESFSKTRWGGASYERKVAAVAGYLYKQMVFEVEGDA